MSASDIFFIIAFYWINYLSEFNTIMKKIKIAFVALFTLVFISSSDAQFSRWYYQFMAKLRQTPWVVGGGWNVVDDDGRPFKKVFDVNKGWNIPAYPSRLFAQKVLDKEKGWGVELGLTYNRHASGNYINSTFENVSGNKMLIAVDVAAIYDFNKLYDLNALMFGEQEIFQPYAHMGFAYTYRSIGKAFAPPHAGLIALGLGFNVWVYQGWGIHVESVSKISMASKFPFNYGNYMQHSIGVSYKWQPAPMSLGKRYKFKKHEIKKSL